MSGAGFDRCINICCNMRSPSFVYHLHKLCFKNGLLLTFIAILGVLGCGFLCWLLKRACKPKDGGSVVQTKIGSIVQDLGIPASILRYYETVGLIKPVARVGSSRHYDESDITQLKFIQLAKSVGFSIEEIKVCIGVLSGEKKDEGCNNLIQSKLKELEANMKKMEIMRNALKSMSDCSCTSIESCVEYAEQVKSELA